MLLGGIDPAGSRRRPRFFLPQITPASNWPAGTDPSPLTSTPVSPCAMSGSAPPLAMRCGQPAGRLTPLTTIFPLSNRPGLHLTGQGEPVLAHLRAAESLRRVSRCGALDHRRERPNEMPISRYL